MNIRKELLHEKPLSMKMFLCFPDTRRLSSLKDVYSEVLTKRLGSVNELSFSIPARIMRRGETIDNPLIDKLKHRYLIEVIIDSQKEYFVILEDSKSYSSDGENISLKMKSRAFLLADKLVRSYLEESKTLSEHVNILLSQTKWKIGYADAEFDLMRRAYEAPSQTVLEAIFGIAEKFKAIILFDTVKLRIDFYSPSKIGRNRGLKFKRGKYLESFDVDMSSMETVTRLMVYGAEGLTFRSLSPTGSNYLEDFGYYMYPFERDANGKVTRSSYYMSDGLCSALVDYTSVLSSVQGEFDKIVERLVDAQSELQKREQELSVLNTELVQIMESIDVLNSNGDSGSPQHQQKINEKNSKENEIENKRKDIESAEGVVGGIENERDDLREQVRTENHLSSENLLELDDFIIVKEYTNDSIVDEEDLLEDGIKTFNSFREPSIDISLGIANFLEVVEFQNDWKKLNLGDIVKIESKILRVGIEARIMEIEYDKEEGDIKLRIANENELKNDYDKMIDEIYSASSTSTIVNSDRYKWDLAEDANDNVSKILNSAWDATKQSVEAGYKQMLDITERGIFVRSPEDPRNLLVLQNGVLGLSNNGGDNWNLAITPDGVFAERLVGRILIGNKLVIEDEDGIIEMVGSKQTIYDSIGKERVVLGEYESGKYGIKINSGAIEIVGGLTEDNISPEYTENVKYDDAGLRQDLRLTAPLPNNITLNSSGITASTSNGNNFARLDYRGLYVQGGAIDIRTSATSSRGVLFNSSGISGYNTSGTRTFHLDTNGNLTANSGSFGGTLVSAGGSFSGNLQASGGTFTGTLSGVDGTFSGNLSAASGTFTGTLSGVDGTFTNLSSGTINGATITGSEFNSYGYNEYFETYQNMLLDAGNIVFQNEGYAGFTRLAANTVEFGNREPSLGRSMTLSDRGIRSVDSIAIEAPLTVFDGSTQFSRRVDFEGTQMYFAGAQVYGLTVSDASYANKASTIESYNDYASLEFAINPTGDRLYVRRNGSVQGFITLS